MNIKQPVTLSALAILSALIAVPACNQTDPVGDLIVPFEIGAGIECSIKGVADVEVTLLELKSGVADDVEIESTRVPCTEGKARFDNVPVGTYALKVEGFDADDFVVVDNVQALENGVVGKPEVGEVLEGRETVASIVNLSSTPAKLWVRFALNKDGFQSMCSQIPMTELQVTTYKNQGADKIISITLPCTATPTETGQYHYLTDPERKLDGSVFDYVRVQPRDATGNMTGLDLKYALPEPPGAGRTVKLTFSAECTAEKCDLKCNGDACTQD